MDLVCMSALQRARAPLSTLRVRDSFNLIQGRGEATAHRFLAQLVQLHADVVASCGLSDAAMLLLLWRVCCCSPHWPNV